MIALEMSVLERRGRPAADMEPRPAPCRLLSDAIFKAAGLDTSHAYHRSTGGRAR